MPCAAHHFIRAAYWCDFDVVSSGLPPPFSSFLLSPLVASAVSGLRTLSVWFCFFCFRYPRHYASACSHFNRRHSPTLRPVFTQLAHTAFGGGCGIRTHDVLRFFATVLGCLYRRLRPLSQPACLRFTFFSKFYLNNFMSSYNPSAMFFAI